MSTATDVGLAIPDTIPTPGTAAGSGEEGGTRTYLGGLASIRAQLDAAMAAASTEAVERLFDAVCDGEIGGASWRGHTKCPLAWLGVSPQSGACTHDETYLVEGFVFPVMPGQTPQTSGRLRRIEVWVALHLARRYNAQEQAEREWAEREAVRGE